MGNLLLILAAVPAIWVFLYLIFRAERLRLGRRLREDASGTGELLILGPQNGYYAKTSGFWQVHSMGVMALTDKRLIFRVMFGLGFDIPVESITDVTDGGTWFQGMYRNGQDFLVLKLSDGSQIGFQTKNLPEWVEKIRSLASANSQ